MSEFLRRFNILIFSIILLFSLAFRVANLDLIEFKTDEAVNLILASKFAPGGTVSSIGILNPPLFNYILTPLTFITLDPKVFSFLIAILNSISIAFFYLIVRKYYGQITVFTSSILFAFSPWAILYSRKIWTQDLLVPFFILLFFSFHKIFKENRQIYWIALTLSSLFLIQLHQISVFFIVLLFIFLFFQRVKFNLKYILIGTILGVIPLFPYLGYEIKNGYPDIKSLVSSEQRLSSKRSSILFLRPLQITNQGNFSFILGTDLETYLKNFPFMDIVRRIFYFEYILVIAGAILFFKKYPTFRVLFYSSALLPVIYFLIKVDPFMHYYIIILPLLFLFLGVAFDHLLSKGRLLKSLSLVLFLSLVVSSLFFNFTFFEFLREQGFLRGDYGDTLKISQTHIKHKNYDELFLFQFIPLTYSFGYNPFAKIVYNTNPSQIPYLEKKLKESDDPRTEHKLLAFYTKEPPNLDSLDTLRKKSRENPIYNNIYKVTLDDYLAKNYKKEYSSDKFDLRFFYPQHWKISEDKTIKIEGDNLLFVIDRGKSLPKYKSSKTSGLVILGDKAQKIECKIDNHSCGAYYSFKEYSAQIYLKNTNELGAKNELSAVDEILNSMRYLSD